MKRYCLTLDLINDANIIESYKKHHKSVWPEIKDSIRESGVKNMDIYITAERLFMIMEVEENFSFEKKAKMDAANPKVREWEKLMGMHQAPNAKSGEKWVLMDKIFDLNE